MNFWYVDEPSAIYHAAAYKHVPLMGHHVFEALENNVFGTYKLVDAAVEHGVEDFLLISSDKAIRPTNVMGATKRIAETNTSCISKRSHKAIVAVRCWQMYGLEWKCRSNFQEANSVRWADHLYPPEMRRFFMTIPEGMPNLFCRLWRLEREGRFAFSRWESPLKIVDLAKKLILLSGLRPGEDIVDRIHGREAG